MPELQPKTLMDNLWTMMSSAILLTLDTGSEMAAMPAALSVYVVLLAAPAVVQMVLGRMVVVVVGALQGNGAAIIHPTNPTMV